MRRRRGSSSAARSRGCTRSARGAHSLVRPHLGVQRLGWEARSQVLESELLPAGLTERYSSVSGALLERVTEGFAAVGSIAAIRLHGDCHLGNLLWNEHGPAFVDLDDCAMGPRVQDLWMMLSGPPREQQRQWSELLEGYQQFADFDPRELRLIEPLRSLRMLHHAAWVAHRWSDPAFPRAFPWLGEERYWESTSRTSSSRSRRSTIRRSCRAESAQKCRPRRCAAADG